MDYVIIPRHICEEWGIPVLEPMEDNQHFKYIYDSQVQIPWGEYDAGRVGNNIFKIGSMTAHLDLDIFDRGLEPQIMYDIVNDKFVYVETPDLSLTIIKERRIVNHIPFNILIPKQRSELVSINNINNIKKENNHAFK